MSALNRLLDEFASRGATSDRGRQEAAQTLRARGLPERREENWRYANLRAIDNVATFLPPVSGTAQGSGSPPPHLALPPPLPGFERLVLVDGVLRADSAPSHPALVRMAKAARAPASASTDFAIDNRLGLIATLFAPSPLTLRVTAALNLEILVLSTLPDSANYLHLTVQIAPGVSCQLVERHLGGSGAHGLGCSHVELDLAADASLIHHRLFAGSQPLQFDTLEARVAQQARYQLHYIAVGSDTSRSTACVRLEGRGAALDWRALGVAHAKQVNDTMLTVRHEGRDTRSVQTFRGIAGDQARVACNAITRVSDSGAGSNVTQSLRGLIDGKGAEVDLRPQLIIDTDDVQARHGATTGQLDENLMFYLQARGLDVPEARALLKWAFLGEVFTSIAPSALRRAAELAAAARLADAPAAELLHATESVP